MLDIKILKTGKYIPDTYVTNDDLSHVMDTSHEWIFQRTGIAKRAIAKNMSLLKMTKYAIQNMNLTDEELKSVDSIIVASMSFEDKSPGLSAQIQDKFDFNDNIMCFDINVACSGFVYAVDIASAYIKSEIYKNVLVIGADKMSNIIDPLDRGTAILFGDAVSCVLIGSDTQKHVINRVMNTKGSREEIYCEDKLIMAGQDVFRFAIASITNCLENVKKDMDLEDVDYFLFHQANERIIDNVIRKFKLDENKVIKNIKNSGNTSSASIGILLDDIFKDVKKGQTILMIGFGSGLTYGSILYKH
ncbi:MAG: beta-ketoacyl-ACP synthase 3 [Mycoplasmatales bacterium]